MADSGKHWLEVASEYAKDLSASARTTLGLSSAAIGAMLAAAKDFQGPWKLTMFSAGLALFLGSMTAWLLFSASLTEYRQVIGSSMLATGHPTEVGAFDKPLQVNEVKMLAWARVQRILFVFGAWFVALAFLIVHAAA